MTLKEISQYYELRQRLTRYNEALLALRTAAENMTSKLDGMPRSKSGADKVALYGGLIAQLEADVERDNGELLTAKKEAENFIATIEDTYVRTVFTLRFIACKSWGDVAEEIGYPGTLNSLRMMCYRYLDYLSYF